MFVPVSLTIALCLLAGSPEKPLVTLPNPQAALRPETEERTNARHAKVARARAGTAILLHRGAWEYAPENTLTAIRVGFELGADGVELDFRRTKDGVIVLFHDDRLERMLDGVGSVEESYYEELLLYSFKSLPMPAADTERVPTLHDVLQTVRDHAGLLHLDIKEPGIDQELLEKLRKADMLDHVVTYNHYNSEAFRKVGIAKLPFKGSLMEAGQDTSPTEARRILACPGKLVICDDPRAILNELARPAVRISRKPLALLGTCSLGPSERLEAALRGSPSKVPVRVASVRLAIFVPRRFLALARELHRHQDPEIRQAIAWNLGMIAKHRPALVSDAVRAMLLHLLSDRDIHVRAKAAEACGRAEIKTAAPAVVSMLAARPPDLDRWTNDKKRLREKRSIIEVRARCAFALGLLGVKSPAVVKVLQETVKHRAVHRDWNFVGLDGAMAVWALGRLRASEATGCLRVALFRNDPVLAGVDRSKAGAGDRVFPPGWCDFRIRSFALTALAEIGTPQALSTLQAVLGTRGEKAGPFSPQTWVQAAEAMARIKTKDGAILAKLLAHEAPEARRAAILFCLREPAHQYRKLLESRARWALPWWDAQHRGAKPRDLPKRRTGQ